MNKRTIDTNANAIKNAIKKIIQTEETEEGKNPADETEKAKEKAKERVKKIKRTKKTKNIGLIRVYSEKGGLYLFLKIPKEIEEYFKEHLGVKQSQRWRLKNGDFASFYAYEEERGRDAKTDEERNEENNENEEAMTSTEIEKNIKEILYEGGIYQFFDTFGTSYGLKWDGKINISVLRIVGASKGITLKIGEMLSKEFISYYVATLAGVIRIIYLVLKRKVRVEAKIIIALRV